MSTPGSADAVTAALLQITQHAERLAVVDERETAHYREITTRLAELARLTNDMANTVEDINATAVRQAAILDALDGLDNEVAALASRIGDLAGSRDRGDKDAYQPVPSSRWWKLDGAEREDALARLRAWVEQVYRPGYGHLSTTLGPCWEQHPLCLYGLDWLMELWSVLYLTPERKPAALASQAEWQTRLLPALAEQMHLETTRCQHNQPRAAPRQHPTSQVRSEESDRSSHPLGPGHAR